MGPSCFHVQVKFAFCFFGTNKFVGSIENLNRRTNRPSFFLWFEGQFFQGLNIFEGTGIFICQKNAFTSTLFLRQKKICKSTISFVMSDDVNFLHYSFSVEGRMLREVIQSINLIIVQLSTFQGLTYSIFKGYNMRPKINDDNWYYVGRSKGAL